MAGNNQHYIPQFLQRGFASHREGKTAFAWEYRNGTPTTNKRIKSIGAENQFYAEAGDTTIDDTITDAENRYGNLLNRLRIAPPGPVSEPELTGFLAHLEIRTRHLRKSFQTSAEYLVATLLDQLSDTDRFIDILQQQMLADPSLLRDSIVEELRKQHGQTRDINDEVNRLMRAAMANMPAILAAQRPNLAAMIELLKTQAPAMLITAAKAGHLKSLKQTIEPTARVNALAGLSFTIVETTERNLILGDSGAIYLIGDNGRFRPYTQKDDDVRGAILPLSPSKMLVGETHTTVWNFAGIKRQLARCSFEYFISHECTEENRVLVREIGADAGLSTKQELDDIAVQCFIDLQKPPQ